MSTIEKAAARLAARQRSDSRVSRVEEIEAQSTRPTIQREGVGSPVKRSDQTAGRAGSVAAKFCVIDLKALAAKGFLAPGSGRSPLAQEMRRIKRPLLLNIQKAQAAAGSKGSTPAPQANLPAKPPANLIMVTSSLPGEGKTFTSINLAMSLAAEVDRRVLLVDADIARGDVSRQLGLPPSRGLADLLAETSYLSEDGVLTSNVERLSVLPAGRPTDDVDELFASSQMSVLTRALAEMDPNRVVLFDASPLLATTEAAVLARHVGQIVVVVEANRTPQDALTHALALLDGCPDISLVLNKTTGRDAGSYGYGYGAYGADGHEAKMEAL